jgi:undecaprenyl-diphosphatase
LAYFLWRERFLAAPAAMAIAIVPPLCVGLSRLYLDVHWSTDVLAGWCAGLAILAVAVSFYRRWPAPDES